MTKIVFDIETVANDRAKEYYDTVYVPDKRLKDPEKIAANRKDALEKAGLHWWTGRVVCICWKLGDKQTTGIISRNEKHVLNNFFAACNSVTDPFLIGKNGTDFDIPFLVGRCLAHDVGVPQFLRPQRPIDDINRVFGYVRNSQWGKLGDYAWGLGLDGKLADGSQVQTMWDEDKHDEIFDYCLRDVEIPAELLARYTKEYVND
jgi:hypothetical protein